MSAEPSTPLLHRDPVARTEQFKDSPMGRVPEEWDIRALGDLLILIRNGTTAEQVARPTPYPVSRIETIADGSINWMRVGYLEADVSDYRMQPGDILYSHINSVAHMGKVAIYDGSGLLYHGMNLMLLRVDSRKCIPRFLYAVLASDRGRAHARRECKSAVNQASLGQKDITRFLVQVPPLPDQWRIVTVLDIVDEAIAKTEVVIAKLKQVRAGLLHDLLTRGLDENGGLRNPIAHPDQFQDSPLGRIPLEWEVQLLESVTDPSTPICYGIVQAMEFVPDGVPVLTIRDLLGNYSTGLHRTARNIDENYARSRVRPDDVLISVKGTIGRTDVVPQHFQGNISRDLARIRPNDRVRARFLVHLLRSPRGQQILERAQVGTTRAELSIAPLKRLSFAFPLPAEQERIAMVLDEHDTLIRSHEHEFEKLGQLKSGLMADLLIGRVRVPEEIVVAP